MSNYKIENLYEKVYSNYVKGLYGQPCIPTRNQVMAKIDSFTTEDYTPLTSYSFVSGIAINDIRTNFSNIIDDVDILFDSVQDESQEIMNQLTDSLKEHEGVKRELKRIQTYADDISAGNFDNDYLNYNFTETFRTIDDINTLKSDPINLDAGYFAISKDASNVLSLNHYKGKKLEFNILKNFSQVNDYGYVGSTDAGNILDPLDPHSLTYKITTRSPTNLTVALSLQLRPDAAPVNINSVSIDLDSDVCKGLIRLYYKSGYSWQDVDNSLQTITSNKVEFNFSGVDCTHIKLEFIKNDPDSYETNTYWYIINNISITKNTTRKTATLYSKPITFTPYNNELPVIATVKASGDITIPSDCSVGFSVSQDILLNGAFLNAAGNPVSFDSPDIDHFDSSYSGVVFLSDILNIQGNISGVAPYKDYDFNWVPLKITQGQNAQDLVEFKSISKKETIDNSIYIQKNPILFGDIRYTGVYSLSGWVNRDSNYWATFAPLVASGIYTSGINIAIKEGVDWKNIQDSSGVLNTLIYKDPQYSGQWIGYSSGVGYPFDYSYNGHTLRFNEYLDTICGWWRPKSSIVTPTGLDVSFTTNGRLSFNNFEFLPDFYFNNLPYYKIYKFDDSIIEPTIKLYSYQERPISNQQDYYPCNFKWIYQSEWNTQENTSVGVQDPLVSSSNPPLTWIGYNIDISGLVTTSGVSIDSISQITIHGTSSVLDEKEYQLIRDLNDNIQSINLGALDITRDTLKVSDTSFDITYKYKTKNEYTSKWIGYAIVSNGASSPILTITNIKVNNKNINVIDHINVYNMDTGVSTDYTDSQGTFTVVFDNPTSLGGDLHYRISIYCASDDTTGFCANGWVPIKGEYDNITLTLSPLIKIVQNISPISIVSLSNLIYSTSINNKPKAAVYTDYDNQKYIVVSCPSKDTVPGYYFSSPLKKYISNSDLMIVNKGHWVRTKLSGNNKVYYTTGSSNSGVFYPDGTEDYTWNNGNTLTLYPNNDGLSYPVHSSYGNPINIDLTDNQLYILRPGEYDLRAPQGSMIVGSTNWLSWAQSYSPDSYGEYLAFRYVYVDDYNRGFLFYCTGENLPSYYSISYGTLSNIDKAATRLLYKLELTSNSEGSVTPQVKSLNLMVNK